MTRHTRVGLIHEQTPPPIAPDPTDPVVVLVRLRALTEAAEHLADAIDVLTDAASPPAYADDHVRQARAALRSAWQG